MSDVIERIKRKIIETSAKFAFRRPPYCVMVEDKETDNRE